MTTIIASVLKVMLMIIGPIMDKIEDNKRVKLMYYTLVKWSQNQPSFPSKVKAHTSKMIEKMKEKWKNQSEQ
jgi:hypothetical protein